jgi:hypothetical protein
MIWAVENLGVRGPVRAGASGQNGGARAPVRRVIRSRGTRMFLTQAGGWAEHPDHAADFGDVSAALAAAFDLQLREVDLCVLFPHPRSDTCDFTVPLL